MVIYLSCLRNRWRRKGGSKREKEREREKESERGREQDTGT